MSTVQLDDLEAGELSIEFEGCEPWELLEWAFERFGERLAVSTSFQEGGVALIDMAYAIDPYAMVNWRARALSRAETSVEVLTADVDMTGSLVDLVAPCEG